MVTATGNVRCGQEETISNNGQYGKWASWTFHEQGQGPDETYVSIHSFAHDFRPLGVDPQSGQPFLFPLGHDPVPVWRLPSSLPI